MNLQGQREQQALKEEGSLLKAGPEGVKGGKYAAVKQIRSHSSKRAIKCNEQLFSLSVCLLCCIHNKVTCI